MSEPAAARGRSNADRHVDNLERLRRWLDAAERIPDLNGKANITAIALAAGVRRQVLYDERAAALVEAAVAAKGLGMPRQVERGADAAPAWATQTIKRLEERLAASHAEILTLRARVRRFEHLERHLEETGLLAR